MASPSTTTAHAPAEPVEIRRADGERDAYYLQRLQHHWFGAEYDSNETLQADLFDIAGWSFDGDPPEHAPLQSMGVIAEHATPQGSVRVGGGIAIRIDHDTTVDELPPGSFDAETLAGDPSVWFLLGVVDQAWRGRGIGRRLFQRRLQWARHTDAEIAIAMGWERDGPSSRPLFERAGWVPVETIESLYAETGRTACPDCGVWPNDEAACQCDATVWAMDL